MKRYVRYLAGVAVIALALSACSSEGGSSEEPVKGSAKGDPIKLSVVSYGPGVQAEPYIFDATTAAASAINDAGGIKVKNGEARPIELVICKPQGDDQNPRIKCARDAIKEGVIASVAKYIESDDMVKTFTAAGIPMIGTMAQTGEDYTNPDSILLSGAGPALVSATGAALQNAGAKKVVLTTLDVPSGRALVPFITPVLESEADLVDSVFLPLDPSTDLAPFVARMTAKKPDGITIISSTAVTTRVVTALRQAGFNGKIAIIGLAVNSDSIKEMGDAAEGVLVASAYDAPTNNSNPKIKQFNDEMDKYAPNAIRNEQTINAWVSVHFAAEQIATLDTVDGPSLAKAANAASVDLGVAPTYTCCATDNIYQLPRLPRLTVQYQSIKDGKIVSDGTFVDMTTIIKK